MKVSKFGGSSLADSSQFKKVIAIIQSDPERQYIVVSAPGKRHPKDQKITDLLYEWHKLQSLQLSSDQVRQVISDRYAEIITGLKIKFDLDDELTKISRKIAAGASADYAASRGEYLNGQIMAIALGYEFISPAGCICLDAHGRYSNAYDQLRSVIKGRSCVVPGFYGFLPDGSIKTFPRGGSDTTGAIVARAVGASPYEKWTDVSGLLMADPRVVPDPRPISVVTYRELRELAYMGANVFHEEAIFPVLEAGITTNIRNTNEPDHPGTAIVAENFQLKNAGTITGIAGRKNFTVITIEKRMMNQQVGFVRQISTVLEASGISFEHMPSGIDTLSIVIDDQQLSGKLNKVVSEIKTECSPDSVEVFPGMAMIAAVGRGMIHTPGVAAKLFTALARAGVNIRMINQGSSEINIIIGVENDDYEIAVRAIYQAFA